MMIGDVRWKSVLGLVMLWGLVGVVSCGGESGEDRVDDEDGEEIESSENSEDDGEEGSDGPSILEDKQDDVSDKKVSEEATIENQSPASRDSDAETLKQAQLAVRKLVGDTKGYCFRGVNVETVGVYTELLKYQLRESFDIDNYRFTLLRLKDKLEIADKTMSELFPTKELTGVRARYAGHESVPVRSINTFKYVYEADIKVEIKDFKNVISQEQFDFLLKTQSSLYLKDYFTEYVAFRLHVNDQPYYVAPQRFSFERKLKESMFASYPLYSVVNVVLEVEGEDLASNAVGKKNQAACGEAEEQSDSEDENEESMTG